MSGISTPRRRVEPEASLDLAQIPAVCANDAGNSAVENKCRRFWGVMTDVWGKIVEEGAAA